MEIGIIFFIALGLAMDISAIGLSSGTAIQKDRVMIISRIAILVALFHALMLCTGWFFGSVISEYIETWAKYVSGVLLIFIGANIVQKTVFQKDEESILSFHTWSGVIALSIATSIDALAVGVSFGVVQNSIFLLALITTPTILITTATTFWLGGKISDLVGKQAEVLGGCVLILIGIFFML